MCCCDHEIPKVVGFSENKERIFYISDKGFFMVWESRTLLCRYEQPYKKPTINMHVSQKKPEIILCFQKEIIVLDTDEKNYKPKGKPLKFKDREISEMKVN